MWEQMIVLMTLQKIELKILFHWLAVIADKISATMPTSFITAAGHRNFRSPVGIAKANRSTKRKGRACQWKPCSLLFIEISCGVRIKRTVTRRQEIWGDLDLDCWDHLMGDSSLQIIIHHHSDHKNHPLITHD